MSSGLIIGLEMALVLDVVIGLAAWELVNLRRDRKPPPPDTPPPPGWVDRLVFHDTGTPDQCPGLDLP